MKRNNVSSSLWGSRRRGKGHVKSGASFCCWVWHVGCMYVWTCVRWRSLCATIEAVTIGEYDDYSMNSKIFPQILPLLRLAFQIWSLQCAIGALNDACQMRHVNHHFYWIRALLLRHLFLHQHSWLWMHITPCGIVQCERSSSELQTLPNEQLCDTVN